MLDRETTQELSEQIAKGIDMIYTLAASGDISRQQWQEIYEKVRWIRSCANEV